MAGKGFYVKIQLDLHAITCPGVWLCPNGTVALQISTLNCDVESHKISPVFPLLFHDKFTFKKVFTGLTTLAELQRNLEREILYAELIQWANASSRGIVLATFETNLADVLYPAPCFKGLLSGVDVDLLTEPTKYFPGIIAPKIEISTRTSVEEVLGVCECTTKAYVVNPKMINSKNTSCMHRKHPAKGIIRQRRVCHSRGKTKTQATKSRCKKKVDTECTCMCCCIHHSENSESQGHKCYHSNKGSMRCSCESSSQRRAYRTEKDPDICNTHMFDSCPVCLKYKCYFSGPLSGTLNAICKNYSSTKEEDTISSYDSSKHTRSSSIDKNFNYISKADEINRCTNAEPAISELHTKINKIQRDTHELYPGYNNKIYDALEYGRCRKHDINHCRRNTHKSLDRIFRRTNCQEQMLAREVECV